MSKTINLKFQFDNPELLKSKLVLNFYDANRKIVRDISTSIGADGLVSLTPEMIALITYFPYSILIKKGTSNLATVLITSKDIFARCLDYDGDIPSDFNTLLFLIDTKTGVVQPKFLAEKQIQQTRGNTYPPATTIIKESIKPSKTDMPIDTKTKEPDTKAPVKTPDLPVDAERYLKGKIVDKTGEVLKNMAFVAYVEELPAIGGHKDIKLLPLLSGKSDSMGTFSVKVPNKIYQSACATVGSATSVFIPIVLENGKLPLFTLLMVDSKTEVVGDKEDSDCGCHDTPPARLPEMEDLMSENSNYQQDIGGSCVNFTTPNRALEEFSYYSVVRLTDPEVMNAPGYIDNLEIRISQLTKAIADSKLPPGKTDNPTNAAPVVPNILVPEFEKIIQNVGNYKTSAELEAAFTTAINRAVQAGEPISPDIIKIRPGAVFPSLFSSIITRIPFIINAFTGYINTQNAFKSTNAKNDKMRGGATTAINNAVTPPKESLMQNTEWMAMELVRLKAELAIANSRTNIAKMRNTISTSNQIQWDAAMPLVQPASIAHGHLLNFRQVWRADGYSMGDLLYSLPLAPGQQKQIAIHDWDRKDVASRTESQSVEESLSNTLSQDRDINEIIKSSLREDVEAHSKVKTSGFSAGLGTAAGASATVPVGGIPISAKVGFSGGMSGGVGTSKSEAEQKSSRDLSGSTMQNIREKTMQNASAMRSQRSTIITTVSQSETTTVTTESIANYNHCHAITIQYFEVLRHLAVYNELADVQECLFIPLTMSLFDDNKVVRWADLLKPALRTPAYQYEKMLKAFDSIRRFYEINALGKSEQEVYYNMPSGRYCDERIKEISGSMRLKINFTCPKKALKNLDDKTADIISKLSGSGIANALMGVGADKMGGLLGGLSEQNRAFINELMIDQTADRTNWKTQLGFIAEVEDIRIKVNKAKDEQREAVFQAEINKINAVAQFAKHLSMVIGTPSITPIDTRIALTRKGNSKNAKMNGEAPSYDFSFRTISNRFSRERDEIISFGVSCNFTNSLPEGSVLMVEHIQANYESDYLTMQLCNVRPADDLLAGTVYVNTPMTEQEMVSPRSEDLRLRNELLDHLNSNMEYYHKAIWVQMDADRRLMLLEGFEIAVPPRENPSYAPGNGEPQFLFGDVANKSKMVSVASVIENRLVGIAGNSLIMPVAKGYNLNPVFRYFNDSVEIDGKKVSRLMSYYMPEKGFKETPFRISIPTKGVFAEAVMGACNSCEKIDNTRYWKWEEHPIPNAPTAIDPVSMDSRYQANNLLTPTAMTAPMLAMQAGQKLPDPTGLDKVFGELAKAGAFTDMTGLAANQTNAIEALKSQTDAAKAYATTAADIAKSMEITKSGDGVAESIKRNVKDPAKQQQLIEDYYQKMIGDDKKGNKSKGGNSNGGSTDDDGGEVRQEDALRSSVGKVLDKISSGGSSKIKTEFPDGTKIEAEGEGLLPIEEAEPELEIDEIMDVLSDELDEFENKFFNNTIDGE